MSLTAPQRTPTGTPTGTPAATGPGPGTATGTATGSATGTGTGNGNGHRRSELAAFLRSRRERIRPEDVGLALGGRRRTPGLRREEVAQLAGVGVTWYTWLEQGRDINVSTQVLDAVARTLRLDRLERSHLYTLAGFSTGPTVPECAAVTEAGKRVLRQVMPYPAAVISPRFDLLAYNQAYRHMIIDLDEVPLADRNLLVLAFVYEDWVCRFADRGDAAAHLVAGYRAAMAEHLDEPQWQALPDRLRAESRLFAELWDRHEVAGPTTRVKVVDSPRAGMLRLEPVNLWMGPESSRRLICYTPADEETATRLEAVAP